MNRDEKSVRVNSLPVAMLPAFLGLLFALGTLSGCLEPVMKAAIDDDPVKLREALRLPNHGGISANRIDLAYYYAAQDNCFSCVQEFLQAGIKPSSFAMTGAAEKGHEKMVRLLIENGADPSEAMAAVRQEASVQEIANAEYVFKKISDESQSRRSASETPTSAVVPPAVRANTQLTPTFQETERPNDYAVIVGIEKYTDLPPATYAESDAESAGAFVRAMGVPARNVVTLRGSRATRSGLVKELENWLAKNTDETSTVYFYFSGHGAPDPATGLAYLVPFDGDPQYLAETAYPLKRLYEKLGALKSKRTIVLLDSCFSGTGGRSVLAKGARPLVNNVDLGDRSINGNIAVLSASGANQISGTNDEKGHGLFTYYLFNGLNGAAKDGSGQVTLKSLYNYLRPNVMDDARRANGDQTPELKADASAIATVLRDK